jgi:hypothetical protein
MATVKTVELTCDQCDDTYEYGIYLHEGVAKLRRGAKEAGWSYVKADFEQGLRMDLCPPCTKSFKAGY